MTLNKNYLLYLAIAIPIIMITVIVISTRFYKIKLYPKYNLLYAILSKDSYACGQQLVQELYPNNINPKPSQESCANTFLYIYNFTNGRSTQIPLEQAKKLNLPKPQSSTSPDGFTLQRYCISPSDGMLFKFDMTDICIEKNTEREKIFFQNLTKDKYNQFVFIGWIPGSQQSQK